MMEDHNPLFKKLSQNLDKLMSQERLSANELAKQTQLPATTIKRIRSQMDANPTLSSLFPIAQYFHISVSQLIGESPLSGKQVSTVPQAGLTLPQIPHLSWSECVFYDELDFANFPKKIVTEKKVSSRGFALTMKEEGVDFFPKGAFLIVDPKVQAVSGSFVLVKKDKQPHAFVKKLCIDVDLLYLKPLVTGLGIIPCTPEYKILGVVVQCRMDFVD